MFRLPRIPGLALSLVFLMSTAVGATSLRWEWVSPQPTGAVLYGVSYGSDRFVAVGAAGTILTSQTAMEWAAQDSGSDFTLRSVTYGAGRFVAVGGKAGKPYRWAIMNSQDGSTWQQSAAGEGAELVQVIFTGEGFLAIGSRQESFDDSTGLLLTSKDGLDWENQTWEGAPPLTGIAYGNGMYIATSSGADAIFSSSDSRHWDRVVHKNAGLWLQRRVAFGNGRFLAAVKYHPALVSQDGQTWTEVTGLGAEAAVVWAGDRFFQCFAVCIPRRGRLDKTGSPA